MKQKSLNKADIRTIVNAWTAPTMTGCDGAGGYLAWALNRGHTHVIEWSTHSSAGDWQFLISKDGKEWRMLEQTNNSPAPGFSYGLWDEVFFGTWEEVSRELEAMLG